MFYTQRRAVMGTAMLLAHLHYAVEAHARSMPRQSSAGLFELSEAIVSGGVGMTGPRGVDPGWGAARGGGMRTGGVIQGIVPMGMAVMKVE